MRKAISKFMKRHETSLWVIVVVAIAGYIVGMTIIFFMYFW